MDNDKEDELTPVGKKLKDFLNGKSAIVEIVIGTQLSEYIKISEDIHIFPLTPIGNRDIIDYGAYLLKTMGIDTDASFMQEALRQGRPFHETNMIIYFVEEKDLAKHSEHPDALRVRSLLGFYTNSFVEPIIKIYKSKSQPHLTHFLAPLRDRGIPKRFGSDPVTEAMLQKTFINSVENLELHQWMDLLAQTQQIHDIKLKISRLYSILEAMSARILSSFRKQNQDTKKYGSRSAIRTLLGYFTERNIPSFIFQVGEQLDYASFDHIELAGRLRDKIFHGGNSTLTEKDITKQLTVGLDVLEECPRMIAHVLRRDCEMAIINWINKTGAGWKAAQGEIIPLPIQTTDEHILSLPRLYINYNIQKGGIFSTFASSNVKTIGYDGSEFCNIFLNEPPENSSQSK